MAQGLIPRTTQALLLSFLMVTLAFAGCLGGGSSDDSSSSDVSTDTYEQIDDLVIVGMILEYQGLKVYATVSRHLFTESTS